MPPPRASAGHPGVPIPCALLGEWCSRAASPLAARGGAAALHGTPQELMLGHSGLVASGLDQILGPILISQASVLPLAPADC